MKISSCRYGLLNLIILLLGITHPSLLQAEGVNDVPRMSVAEVKQLLGNPDVVIIDVRTTKSWWSSTTKISGAVREDPSKVSEWLEKYSKTKTLIFY